MKLIPTFMFRSLFTVVLFVSSFAGSSLPAPASTNSYARPSTASLLEQLGGYPCPNDSAFTCVTVDVPLDHFSPSDPRRIEVTFAVLPAWGSRRGMFVVATGGPGTSGIALADSYTSGYPTGISRRFDIVFFDQRGVGLSGGLTCPQAAVEYARSERRTETAEQRRAVKAAAATFSRHCLSETGKTELLPYLGTAQAVEDLEYFRQLMQVNKFWLYGESYGTQYAQTYAARYSPYLAGLILDGVVDLTLTGFEFYAQQAQAFNNTLTATLEACNNDPYCLEDVAGSAIEAYDLTVQGLKAASIPYEFPLPDGGFEQRFFTIADLETVTAGQMYTEADRLMLNRALASSVSYESLVPLARLLHLSLGVDPHTLEVIPDPSYSDAMFYAVECQDYGYPGDTTKQKAANYFAAGDQVVPSIPWLGSVFYGDLPCVFWPQATTNLTRPQPLRAAGVPTLVLNAAADPATPLSSAVSVFRRLQNGYLITQRGGPHVIFGWGNPCPDNIVANFLVNGRMPASRSIRCPGVTVEEYVPISPTNAADFTNLLEALSWTETELSYLPEYFYWDGYTRTQVGCPLGGTFAFEAGEWEYFYTFDQCSFAENFTFTGTGSYDPYSDIFAVSLDAQGRWQCAFEYTRTEASTELNSNCDGTAIQQRGRILSPVQKGPIRAQKIPGRHNER